MNQTVENVVAAFRHRWSADPELVAMAPGRVNIIGEHTDYMGGFVLPMAINRSIVIAASKESGKTITGFSVDFNEEAHCHVGDYDPEHPSGWFRYVMGVLSELGKDSAPVEAFRFTMGGDIPIGSGLSSSAALEMSVLTALEGLFGFRMSDNKAALLCQRAENNFVGMKCGIMDQLVSRTGMKDHAILIDCASLTYKSIIASTPEYSWIIIDSRKRRSLVDSEYNRRREECEEALKTARKVLPGRAINNLREVAVDDLERIKPSCDSTVFRRLRHVVTENKRVMHMVNALQSQQIERAGSLLNDSHESLRDDFAVSCEELDMLVDILSGIPGVAGARLTGAGFGGCVIALIKTNTISDVTIAMKENYHPPGLPGNTQAEIWPVTIADGARLIKEW